MASIRRTLSPSAHDHPSRRKIPFFPSPLSSSSPPSNPFRRILTAIPIRKSYRKWAHRLLLFFLLGLLLGFSPFSKTDDLDLSSRVPPPKIRNNVVNVIAHEEIVSVELKTRKRDDLPKLLIVITPTYSRALQAYYLTRLAHTLRRVPPPILWIVIESGRSASLETASLLRETGLAYRHLVCGENSTDAKDRGVHQRNTGLQHIERHRLDGIVYFADDDNVYSLDLFRHLREIRRFGTWPVAMLARSKNKAILEGPVCNGTRVIGWHTNEKSRRLRRFHVDMSGFAFNSTILWDPKRWNRSTSNAIRQLDTVKEGFQETTFIEQLVEDENQMEGLPHDCSRIMNWHLHLEARHLVYPEGWHVSRNLDVVSPLS